MNIDKALEHFKWKLVETDKNGKPIKLKSSFKPTKTDLEAYNSILDYKETNERYAVMDNESLAKLWMHQLILLSETNSYTGERCIQVIDEILSKSTYDWCVTLQKSISMMRFNAILKESNGITLDNEDRLKEALIHKPKEEDVIKFVNKQINRVINKFEKSI